MIWIVHLQKCARELELPEYTQQYRNVYLIPLQQY